MNPDDVPVGATAARAPATAGSGSSSGGPGGSTGPASAAQLAADQVSVDAATAAQQAARQNLDQTQLRSPAAGVVQSVTLAAGDQVSAGSTAGNVVIRSPGGEQAVAEVPVTAMASVSPGEHATVTAGGSGRTLTGTVRAIGLLPDATGTSYPVTVAMDGGTGLPDGSAATVSLVPASGAGVETVVPTSALTARGRGYTVQLDDHGRLSTVAVTVGASGPVYTQITSGLTPGQRVVLADPAAPLPTAGTGPRGFGGGFGGGRGSGAGRGGGGG